MWGRSALIGDSNSSLQNWCQWRYSFLWSWYPAWGSAWERDTGCRFRTLRGGVSWPKALKERGGGCPKKQVNIQWSLSSNSGMVHPNKEEVRQKVLWGLQGWTNSSWPNLKTKRKFRAGVRNDTVTWWEFRDSIQRVRYPVRKAKSEKQEGQQGRLNYISFRRKSRENMDTLLKGAGYFEQWKGWYTECLCLSLY